MHDLSCIRQIKELYDDFSLKLIADSNANESPLADTFALDKYFNYYRTRIFTDLTSKSLVVAPSQNSATKNRIEKDRRKFSHRQKLDSQNK